MKHQLLLAIAGSVVMVLLLGTADLAGGGQACAAESRISFVDDVFPILQGRCVSCHQPGAPGHAQSGLDLTTYDGLMKGTKHGPMVVPGDPATSNLVWLLDWRASPQLRMPHGKKQLSTCDRDAIRTWIRQGAHDN